MCQRLKLKQDDGVTYNQHVIYDFDNDVTIIEQCYYESDISIKQIFDCDQYLSEGIYLKKSLYNIYLVLNKYL